MASAGISFLVVFVEMGREPETDEHPEQAKADTCIAEEKDSDATKDQ